MSHVDVDDDLRGIRGGHGHTIQKIINFDHIFHSNGVVGKYLSVVVI